MQLKVLEELGSLKGAGFASCGKIAAGRARLQPCRKRSQMLWALDSLLESEEKAKAPKKADEGEGHWGWAESWSEAKAG